MYLGLVWFALGVVASCSGTFSLDSLEGSEASLSAHGTQDRTSSLPHYLFNNPWAPKLAVFSYLQNKKPTVTKTKTLILQTVRKERRHLMCYKPRHGLPPCLHGEEKEERTNYILPTRVPDITPQRETQYLGILDNGEIRDEYADEDIGDESVLRESERGQRHLFGLFKPTKYVTKTLWVTKVEEYINTGVTATLLPANCIPSSGNIPPCPSNVEHYVHHDSHLPKPSYEKERTDFGEDAGEDREASRGQNRWGKDSLVDPRVKEDLLEVPTNENISHYVDKKTEP